MLLRMHQSRVLYVPVVLALCLVSWITFAEVAPPTYYPSVPRPALQGLPDFFDKLRRPERLRPPVRPVPAYRPPSDYPSSAPAGESTVHDRQRAAVERVRRIAQGNWLSTEPIGKIKGREDLFALAPHVAARLNETLAPVTPVGSGFKHQHMILPQRPVTETPPLPMLIFQSWSEEAVGPVTFAASSSWFELNPSHDYILLNDAASDAYAAAWMPEDDTELDAVHTALYFPLSAKQLRLRAKGDDPRNYFVSDGCSHVDKLKMSIEDMPVSRAERRRLREVYARLDIGATKADLLRLFLLYEIGGQWFDLDNVCVRPLRAWVDPAATFVTGLGVRGDPHQWGMLAAPRHPAVALTLRYILANLESRDGLAAQTDIEAVAGPPVLHRAWRELLCSRTWHDAVAQGLQFFKTDHFDGRVVFKAEGISEEWSAHGRKHWLQAEAEARQKMETAGS